MERVSLLLLTVLLLSGCQRAPVSMHWVCDKTKTHLQPMVIGKVIIEMPMTSCAAGHYERNTHGAGESNGKA